MLIAWTNRETHWRTKCGILPIYDTESASYYEGTTRKIMKLLRGGTPVENCRIPYNGTELRVDDIPVMRSYIKRIFVEVIEDDKGLLATYIVDNDWYCQHYVCRGIVFLGDKRYGVIVPPCISNGTVFCPVYTIKMGELVFQKHATVADTDIFTYHPDFYKRYMRNRVLEKC